MSAFIMTGDPEFEDRLDFKKVKVKYTKAVIPACLSVIHRQAKPGIQENIAVGLIREMIDKLNVFNKLMSATLQETTHDLSKC